jgi:hypothetical protein
VNDILLLLQKHHTEYEEPTHPASTSFNEFPPRASKGSAPSIKTSGENSPNIAESNVIPTGKAPPDA